MVSVRFGFTLLFAVVVCLGIAGCRGGAGNVQLKGADSTLRPAGLSGNDSQPGSADDPTWGQYADPGTPGVDYDPRTIIVGYLRRSTTDVAVNSQKADTSVVDDKAKPNASFLQHNREFAAVTDRIENELGITARQEVYIGEVNIASFAVPDGTDADAVLATLRTGYPGEIAYAAFEPLRHADYVPDDPDMQMGPDGEQWGHYQINCPSAWDITTGDPDVVVAVVDTGVRLDHTELVNRVIHTQTAFPTAYCDVVNHDKTMEDLDGHGTFIAGVVVAEADNGFAIAGVAPDCRVLPIKISNEGAALTSDIVAGCFLAQQLGARAINLSFGGDTTIPAEEQMVNQVTAAGCLFVTSAGNDGVSSLSYPAAFANAVAVGSTGYYDSRASFSNWGSYVDIAAPGIDIKSCSPFGYNAFDYNGQGTSYSAPMVAAAAGLIWSYKPELSNIDVRDILESTGMPTYGFAPIPPVYRLDIGYAMSTIVDVITPQITGVGVAEGTITGRAAEKAVLPVSVTGAQDVAKVVYTLDVAPLYTLDENDPQVTVATGANFAGNLNVPLTEPNQFARLVVDYYSSSNHTGPRMEVGIVLFNQLGEVDGDGVVTGDDFDAIADAAGMKSGDEGFNPFCDSNFDGVINEVDVAAVGYFWGDGAVVPEITNVEFTPGTQGTPVTFTPEFVGTAPVEFSWDFNGGCDPGTSTEQAPTVMLGLQGKYNVDVTATNEYGSDDFSFEMTVGAPVGSPPDVFSIRFDDDDEHRETVVDSTIFGTNPFSYSWDFGGCCEPNTSNDQRPVVVLNGPGNYQVKLTVSNAVGSDTYEEYITIKTKPSPTVKVDRSTPWGRGPLEVTFDASRSSVTYGGIVQYDWSWDGDETYEETTAEPVCSHTFTELGTHTVRVQATDEIGKTGSATTAIEVKDMAAGEWVMYEIGYCGGQSTANPSYIDYTLVGNNLALIWQNRDNQNVEYIQASVSQPTTKAQWEQETVVELGRMANDITLTCIDGYPAAAIVPSNINSLEYYRRNGSGWQSHEILPEDSMGRSHPKLSTINGKPAVVLNMEIDSEDNVRYLAANTAEPDSAGDWSFSEIFMSSTGNQLYMNSNCHHQVVEIDNKPVVTFLVKKTDSVDRLVMRANTSNPTGPADWHSHVVLTKPGTYTNAYGILQVLNGKPAILCSDVPDIVVGDVSRVCLATTTAPAGSGDWGITIPNNDAGPWFIGMGSDTGNPVISWSESGGLNEFYLATADSPMPATGNDWTVKALPAPSEFCARLVSTADGTPAIFIFDSNSDKLYYYYPLQE